MVPVLIGAAVVGGIAYALSGGDDKNITTTYRTIPESEVPADILRKLKHSRQSGEELLRAEGFEQIPASEVPADIRAKAKRRR